MIIYGSRGKNVQVGSGSFFCPRCSSDQHYKQYDVKNYFTLYFIPLIPMGKAGEFVECTACGGTYALDILTYDPEVELEETVTSFRRLCVLFLLDVDRCTSSALKAMKKIVSDTLEYDVEKEDIVTDVKQAKSASPDTKKFFKTQSSNLSDDGKLLLTRVLGQILAADGGMHDEESARIVELGKAMGLRAKHVQAELESGDDYA